MPVGQKTWRPCFAAKLVQPKKRETGVQKNGKGFNEYVTTGAKYCKTFLASYSPVCSKLECLSQADPSKLAQYLTTRTTLVNQFQLLFTLSVAYKYFELRTSIGVKRTSLLHQFFVRLCLDLSLFCSHFNISVFEDFNRNVTSFARIIFC